MLRHGEAYLTYMGMTGVGLGDGQNKAEGVRRNTVTATRCSGVRSYTRPDLINTSNEALVIGYESTNDRSRGMNN